MLQVKRCRVPVEKVYKSWKEVNAGDLSRAVLRQRHGLSPGAAADIGDACTFGERLNEAECFQRRSGTTGSLALYMGEIFADQVEVEIVY